MKKILFSVVLTMVLILGLTGCGKKPTIEELNLINDKIIQYFLSEKIEYNNFSYNYVDEEEKVVVIGLLDNSKEQLEKFKKNVINSKYIKFIKSEKNIDNDYYSYENLSTLSSNNVDVKILVKFNGLLYGKSYSIIDYASSSDPVGTIDKLIPNIYIPKLNGETNTANILNAPVFDVSKNSIVIFYNNEYVLFEKV